MNYKDIKVIAARHFGAELDQIILRQYGHLWLASASHGDGTTIAVNDETGKFTTFNSTSDVDILDAVGYRGKASV